MSDPAYTTTTSVAIPSSVIEPSDAFKKEVLKVMGSILLFFIVYLILILLATALAAGTVYGGIALIVAMPRFITLMIGIGLVGLGIMVIFFLIKFIFAVTRFDHSNSIEITETDQPKLFAFVRELAKETQVAFPKRIYLSPEVNACVFYDSSFWSIIFPVKKNLQIGLGLVNALNVSEFKAVMAHEFGHFSQRSMKLGSLVYNLNRIIYNMLFENTGYAIVLEKWANISGYFAFFAGLTARIVNGIQYTLRIMYGLINKHYMGLSREMEFHADAVAASVSGSNTCISALRRIELADTCYNITVQKCGDWFKDKLIISNVYSSQHEVLHHYAHEFRLNFQSNLPVVTDEFTSSHNLSRVNFKDQWASHPTIKERERFLNTLNIASENNQQSAWILFDNADTLQEQLTAKIYAGIELPENTTKLNNEDFKSRYLSEVESYSLPAEYKGFYDRRQIEVFELTPLNDEVRQGNTSPQKFEQIFSDQNAVLPKKIEAAERDIQVLKAIANKIIVTKTFDFDGEKFNRDQAAELSEALEKELIEQQQQLAVLDKQSYQHFYLLALRQNSALAANLENKYQTYFQLRRESESYVNDVNNTLKLLHPLYAGEQISLESVNMMIGQLKEVDERRFKEHLNKWIEKGTFDHNEATKQKIQKFIQSNYAYFSGNSFFDNELNELNQLINEAWSMINAFVFKKFKEILELQIELSKN